LPHKKSAIFLHILKFGVRVPFSRPMMKTEETPISSASFDLVRRFSFLKRLKYLKKFKLVFL